MSSFAFDVAAASSLFDGNRKTPDERGTPNVVFTQPALAIRHRPMARDVETSVPVHPAAASDDAHTP